MFENMLGAQCIFAEQILGTGACVRFLFCVFWGGIWGYWGKFVARLLGHLRASKTCYNLYIQKCDDQLALRAFFFVGSKLPQKQHQLPPSINQETNCSLDMCKAIYAIRPLYKSYTAKQ
jgi:hypothetical protein